MKPSIPRLVRRPSRPSHTLSIRLAAGLLAAGTVLTSGVAPAAAAGTFRAPAPQPSPASSASAMAPACAGANLRTSPSASGRLRASLPLGASVTVSGTVAGAAWSTRCPGAKSGARWYRVTAVGGRSVRSAYGVAALYAATGVLAPAPAAAPAPKPTPAPTPTPAPSAATSLGASVTFYGRGYGHGVGMSQYGALGRAQAGQSAATILAHYYAGTSIGPLAGNPTVRVLVSDETPTASAPLTIYGRGGAWSISGVATSLPADARARVYPVSGGWQIVVDAGGSTLLSKAAPSTLVVAPVSSAGVIQVASLATRYDRFRGALQVTLGATSARLINSVPMESYLRGVVPAEMPSSWPAAALQAQAIAARSYAAYRLHPTSGSYDIFDDTRSQVYLGQLAETATTDAAVLATAGQVVLSAGKVANTVYHSSDGGATESNQFAFTSTSGAITSGALSYLRGSSDRNPAGVSYDAASPYAAWRTATYSRDALSAIFGADSRTSVGSLSALLLTNRGVSGRLISVTLYGSAGTKVVSGSLFTDVFNANRPAADAPMRSTLLALSPIP